MNTKNGYVSCLNANNKIPLPQSTQKKERLQNSVDSELHFDRYIGHESLIPSNSLEHNDLHLSTKMGAVTVKLF